MFLCVKYLFLNLSKLVGIKYKTVVKHGLFMKLTTKGRYAVMAMADLASYSKDKPVSLSEISSRQNISLAYLEQLFIRLKEDKLVKSIRGVKGGYATRQTCI